MHTAPNSDVLTLSEAAAFVRVSERTLGEMARSGRVPCQKVGREWRFLKSALRAWLAHREPAQAVAEVPVQYSLGLVEPEAPPARATAEGFGDTAFTKNRSEPLHRWVPWIAGFSSSFVNGVLDGAKGTPLEGITVLDPFAGVGTTLVEAVRRGCNAVGFEINPYAELACRTKINCFGFDLKRLRNAARDFRAFMLARSHATPRARPPAEFSSRVPFFSPKVERKVLRVLDFIAEQHEPWVQDVLRVALGAMMVSFSNYSYEPSLGRRSSAGKQDILDADVAGIVEAKLAEMIADVAGVQQRTSALKPPSAEVFCDSFLTSSSRVRPRSIDFLITSPPYLNNYHYIRNTRPQLFWLGLVQRRAQLKDMEHANFGKFWQTVRSGPSIDLQFDCPELASLLAELRSRSPHRGVYGGAGWANYAAAYFNDCHAFCRAAHGLMKPASIAVAVIGNNILQGIEFKTDEYFAQIAQRCGFELVQLHRVRKKRTGSSIVNSSVRSGSPSLPVELYETAIELAAR